MTLCLAPYLIYDHQQLFSQLFLIGGLTSEGGPALLNTFGMRSIFFILSPIYLFIYLSRVVAGIK
jgi:hypothetical protein